MYGIYIYIYIYNYAVYTFYFICALKMDQNNIDLYINYIAIRLLQQININNYTYCVM